MKQAIALVAFMLTMLVWTAAQQQPSGGQSTSPGSQTPGASQPQPSAPGGAGQDASQPPAAPGDQSQVENLPVTEGCLSGTSPDFTLTDKAGKTYKLSFPPNANIAALQPHVGESVRVMGPVKSSSIDVSKIGRGTGNCPNAPKGSVPKG
jgi:hypothetical protein